MSQKIITRFAPSPTGQLHIGSVRTALFNFLYTRKHGGKFILRIEDTDKERSKKEFETDIIEGLSWLGLGYDELYRQSDRGEIYKNYIEKMLSDGSIYQADDKVIRFKNPNKKVKFNDLIRGEIEFDTTELKDFVIAKSADEPLYHLAVVIDDFESGITHVIRGEDHISNTPRQILIQEAIGAARPLYVHLPLILAQDRSKLSKRKHGESVSLNYYRSKGYSAKAIINYLALLGWNPGTEQEIFTLEELIKVFDFSRVHKGGAIFDEKKLAWVARKHFNLAKLREK
ncbi:MAG: hypothetical protein A3C70_00520 [Candidatus Zambryskibacteria bacterium RIFCSPHIGHO2_02_FULL_43_14]|uniref:Glutamyl/glutaminyl-tRNA synthetase class Ib catalytic domain-containing protein n=1 Tax=Candidatus Zambryskibacteria bacterium RIFCSPHIGHO2_02_FULL_43_14 TaxID=1802748 RepID=A0A1G2THZ8_9BACT|nr:MAG: hypothetical protein A2829_02095 [Candidatus Zambryskibacteria bacterium RIFCSPHIGHO2_01_FULL_43_60]OHA96823.1 MAG: hypothetical protein A3C70_00520 [Candidatus Zambryskibacteria bacterium RIFCSPHIGHO2_02_FULL_43_14]OHB04079.1 MAG: hypothetical protein A3B03_01345 [Candidatus Zambryskibacteria bacterium RIFCSPLOWO2_01_FULL_42_41]